MSARGVFEWLGSDVVIREDEVRNFDFVGLSASKFLSVGSRFVNCRFIDCEFSSLVGGGYDPTVFSECEFVRTKADRLSLLGGTVERCRFEDVRIKQWDAEGTNVIDSSFTGRLGRAIFWGTTTRTSEAVEFHGNDFSGLDMRDVAFRRGIDLMSQKLPCDPPYLLLENPAAALTFAFERVQTWDEQARLDAEILIGIIRDDVTGGQKQWFGRSDMFGKSRREREVSEGLFALLAAGDGQGRTPVGDEKANVISLAGGGVFLDTEVDVAKSPLLICDPYATEGPDLANDVRSIMTTDQVIVVRVADGPVRVVAQGEHMARPEGALLHEQQLGLSRGELMVGSPLQQDEHVLDLGAIRSTRISIYGDKLESPSLVWIVLEQV